jgi:prevent-host-death family protein
MQPIVINATELRVRTREIMERVKYKGDRFLIQTFGRPTAIILSVEEYNMMILDNDQVKGRPNQQTMESTSIGNHGGTEISNQSDLGAILKMAS